MVFFPVKDRFREFHESCLADQSCNNSFYSRETLAIWRQTWPLILLANRVTNFAHARYKIGRLLAEAILFERQLTQRKCSHCSRGICYIDHYWQNTTMYFTKCRRRLRSAKFSFYLNRVTESLFNVSVNLLAYGLNVVFWFKGCEVFVCYTSCSPSWLSISSACPWRCTSLRKRY